MTLGVALVGLLRLWPKVRPAELGLPARRDLRAGLIAGIGLWLLSILVANAQAALIGAHPQALLLAAASHRSVEGLVIDLVFGAGIVAFVEELFFRAVLFALLRQRMRFAYAAALSSALFALAHEPAAWVPVFALGIGLAWLYERRHSLWTNAFAHGTVNAISFVLLFFVGPNVAS